MAIISTTIAIKMQIIIIGEVDIITTEIIKQRILLLPLRQMTIIGENNKQTSWNMNGNHGVALKTMLIEKRFMNEYIFVFIYIYIYKIKKYLRRVTLYI